jgi:hypothetical protein
MRGWYILPVMTPTHLLSVQVLEDERIVEGVDWYILPVLNYDTSSPPLCAGAGG